MQDEDWEKLQFPNNAIAVIGLVCCATLVGPRLENVGPNSLRLSSPVVGE